MTYGPFSPSAAAVVEPIEKLQLLSFFLGNEEYAVDILSVQEIRVWEPPTRLPSVPPFVKGVLNLRGEIVPVIDLRERFDLPVPPYDKHTVIVVLQVESEGRRRAMGTVVDRVCDVYHIERSALLPSPPMGGPIDNASVLGLATAGETMLIVLDVNKILDLGTLLASPARPEGGSHPQ